MLLRSLRGGLDRYQSDVRRVMSHLGRPSAWRLTADELHARARKDGLANARNARWKQHAKQTRRR